jgi:hypothetical protein
MSEHTVVHRGRRRIWLALGALVVIFGLVVGGLYLWSWVGSQTESQHQSYDRDISRIEVDTKAVDVTLVAGRPGHVVVDRDLKWSFGKPEIREIWDGGTLRVTAGCRSAPQLPGCSVRYRIEVPAGVSVDAQTSAGSLSVTGIDGDSRLSTSSGALVADKLGGALWARASSGTITATGLRSSTVDVASSSGATDLRFTSDPRQVTANVRSGDFTMRVPQRSGPYSVILSVKSGTRAVDVEQSNAAQNHINVESLSGNVRIQYTE